MPDAGVDVDDLIGDVLNAQHGRAARRVWRGRVVLGRVREDWRGREPEQQQKGNGRDSWGHGFSLFSAPAGRGELCERGLEAVAFNRFRAAGAVARG